MFETTNQLVILLTNEQFHPSILVFPPNEGDPHVG